MATRQSRWVGKIVKESLAPKLKELGFKRRGRAWNRVTENFVQVIDVQSSRYPGYFSGSFTINLGIFSPKIYELRYDEKPPAFISSIQQLISIRVSTDDVGFSEIWWDVNLLTDLSALGAEVLSRIDAMALPFFVRFDSLEKVDEWWDEDLKGSRPGAATPGGLLDHALIKFVRNDRAGVQKIVSEYFETRQVGEYWDDIFKSVLSRVGVDVPG
ncbi:MAG: hypothetical protein COB53_10535 [Elusimicrobia bacterium]|nr:MAG: hypothetical protein COB53_10535 [Elusimicrobiota bacterium]